MKLYNTIFFQQNSSERIEELLLKQIQLITVGQTYPVWIAQNLYIYFTVGKLKFHFFVFCCYLSLFDLVSLHLFHY